MKTYVKIILAVICVIVISVLSILVYSNITIHPKELTAATYANDQPVEQLVVSFNRGTYMIYNTKKLLSSGTYEKVASSRDNIYRLISDDKEFLFVVYHGKTIDVLSSDGSSFSLPKLSDVPYEKEFDE